MDGSRQHLGSATGSVESGEPWYRPAFSLSHVPVKKQCGGHFHAAGRYRAKDIFLFFIDGGEEERISNRFNDLIRTIL
jgi:hypothetical protein